MGLPNNLADWKTTSNYTGKVPSTFYLLENSYSIFLSALQSLSIPPHLVPIHPMPPHWVSQNIVYFFLFLLPLCPQIHPWLFTLTVTLLFRLHHLSIAVTTLNALSAFSLASLPLLSCSTQHHWFHLSFPLSNLQCFSTACRIKSKLS